MSAPVRMIISKALCASILLAGAGLVRADDEPASPLSVGGAVRVNYVYKSWQTDYPRGFVGLDTIRLDVKYDDGRLIGSAQYRYNRYPAGQGGYTDHFLQHGWAGLRFDDKSELHAGLDFMLAKHQPYMSPDFGGLAATAPADDGFSHRINLQAGYYF